VPGQQVAGRSIVDVGDGPASGIYLLHIVVAAPVAVVFGRFAGGKAILVQSGQYLYIGSACNPRGTPSLAHRLLRHLTRTNDQPPQSLRAQLAAHFALSPPQTKRLRWHIDYLLDFAEVAVDQIVILRTGARPPTHAEATAEATAEAEVARHLNALSTCRPVAPGLGASDHPGSTHLLAWHGTDAQWQQTLVQLTQLPHLGGTAG
jgi:Uri superfamily endonuclease